MCPCIASSDHHGGVFLLEVLHRGFSLATVHGSQSIRTQVNSYSSQLVLILVNSYSFWSTRTHVFGQFVLILGLLFEDAQTEAE